MSLTGDRIREFRMRLGLTLDDVAKHLGVGRQAIYKYEQGTVTNIPLENLEKMAALFGTTPGYLAGWDEDPPDEPVPDRPHTIEARSFAKGMDKLPQQERERILNMFIAAYPGIFEKGTDDHDS